MTLVISLQLLLNLFFNTLVCIDTVNSDCFRFRRRARCRCGAAAADTQPEESVFKKKTITARVSAELHHIFFSLWRLCYA